MENELDAELRFYKKNEKRLFKKYPNKYILIKGSKFIDVFETFSDAYTYGITKFGNIPLFIHKTGEPIFEVSL